MVVRVLVVRVLDVRVLVVRVLVLRSLVVRVLAVRPLVVRVLVVGPLVVRVLCCKTPGGKSPKIHEHILMTQPKATENVFSFDYVMQETVNVATVQPWSYGCTWEVCLGLKKLEFHSAIASCNSYASFMLSNLPRASITPWLHVYHFSNIQQVFCNCYQHAKKGVSQSPELVDFTIGLVNSVLNK